MAGKKVILRNVEIVTYAAEGKCIARHDGMVIFVKGLVPGDIADLQITKKKSQYFEAKPISIVKYSNERVEPFCEHYGICGGCKWQHLDYQYQLKYKQQQVEDNLTRIGKLTFPTINPIIQSDFTRFYRNKLEFTFSDYRWLTFEEVRSDRKIDRRGVGFHIPQQYDKIVDINHCHLQPDPSNQIRNFIRKFALENNLSFYNIREFKGLLRNLIIRNTTVDEWMAVVQFGENEPENIAYLMHAIRTNFPEITSLNYVINQKKNETFFDLDVINYSGNECIFEKMGDLRFKISPKSFFQTNFHQAQKLYDKTREFAGLTGKEVVYDLYTGTGTIALYLADVAVNVIGIDNVPQAIEDAQENAAVNQINNATFLAGDAKEMFNEALFHEYGAPDVLVVDPPRAGMHEDLIKVILQVLPKKIVYVSCNPATQARDLALMCDRYKIEKVQPLDMFPHTHHIENIVLLNRM